MVYELDASLVGRWIQCDSCGRKFVAGAQYNTIRTSSSEPLDGSSTSHRNVMSRVFKIICTLLCIATVFGVVAYGAYLYWGDEPRLGRGVEYYENGVYDRAYSILLPLANKGYAKAQLFIGDSYFNGNGVFLDMEEAVKWYRAAAEQGLPEAQYRMCKCCLDGAGVQRDFTNAAKWCRKAAEAGLNEAMYDMGILYLGGTGVAPNAKSAVKWFRKGAERGYPMSLFMLGVCYLEGTGVEKDEDEASKLQNRAIAIWREDASNGNASSILKLARLYRDGYGVELDKEESVRWLRKGVELGNAEAQFELAMCYHNGDGVDQDQEEAAKLMIMASEMSRDPNIQYVMGRYYQEGWGVEKNPIEAVKWYERASKKGLAVAKYYLGMCYLNGEGVQKDVASAEKILEEAALDGNDDAHEKLSQIRKKREAEERRLEREKAEREWEVAAEKAVKNNKIEKIQKIEKVVEERKKRVNDILKGQVQDEVWCGFDAGKITMIDAGMSIAEEQPDNRVSKNLSDNCDMEIIDEALDTIQKEADRLEERLKEFARVKDIYDMKELESRKETCKPCAGTGAVKCARCKGKGAVVVKNKVPCPTCSANNYDDDYDDFSFHAHGDSGRKGQIKKRIRCNACKGSGQIRTKCGYCRGKGRVSVQERGRLSMDKTCENCGGSGRGYPETCSKCHGRGEISVWKDCQTCNGQGVVVNGSKVTCPACEGKGKIKCEHCDGRGFTLRPKQ